MCWLCDNPEATQDDDLRMVREKIDRYGFVVQSVEEDRHYPPFSYTIGRTAQGLPELVVTGLHHSVAQPLLAAIVAQSSSGGVLAPGDQLSVDGKPMEVVALSEPTAHLNIAVAVYGSQISALQLVHADDHGIWPWSPNYSATYRQPVLGPRSARTPKTLHDGHP